MGGVLYVALQVLIRLVCVRMKFQMTIILASPSILLESLLLSANRHEIAEWYAMGGLADYVARIQERRSNLSELQALDQADSTPASSHQLTQEEPNDNTLPQYQLNPPVLHTENVHYSYSQVTVPGQHLQSDEENEELVRLFTNARRFYLLSKTPPPEEPNAWASVADFRDRFYSETLDAGEAADW